MCDKVIKCERTWLKNAKIIAKTFVAVYKISQRTGKEFIMIKIKMIQSNIILSADYEPLRFNIFIIHFIYFVIKLIWSIIIDVLYYTDYYNACTQSPTDPTDTRNLSSVD